IWMVKDGVIKTPPSSIGILEGITRAQVIRLARESQTRKFTCKEESFTQQELLLADECFITSATRKIIPVTKIENTVIGDGKPGKMTLQLSELYQQFIDNYLRSHRSMRNMESTNVRT
ncbi:MAG: aminotransferase class IV, partial [Oligoflexia bacterium]|nr:aminotransferase class IV [Oligoflexia bacterium]